MQQIAVGRVNFQHAITSLLRATRSLPESTHHVGNALHADFAGHRIVRRKRYGAGREHVAPTALCCFHTYATVPRARGAGLAACMRQLYASGGTLRVNEA